MLAECEAAGAIVLEDAEPSLLDETQPHHVRQRRHLAARLAAIPAAGLPQPDFRDLGLPECAAASSPRELGREFAGTLERIRALPGDRPVSIDDIS